MRHRFHALCPYFAMFPEAFAETWIERLTKPNDVVLDPFSGRGTTAFQAVLMGRRAVACDVNDVAYCLTQAKVCAPGLSVLRRRITQLERCFDAPKFRRAADNCPDFFHYAFCKSTLRQLLYLREVLNWRVSRLDGMVAALVLGSLHGEADKSKSYLSNQMPRTISTKPAYSIRFWKRRRLCPPERDVFSILRQRASYRYETPPPVGEAMVIHGDMRRLPYTDEELLGPIRCVITSPPYFDVTDFEEDQWLRLWFLGGPPYPTTGRLSRDDRHSFEARYWQFIGDMWRCLGTVLARKGHVVIRIGSRKLPPAVLSRKLTASSRLARRPVQLVGTEVSELKNRQTDQFRPGSTGCSVEVDCHFRFTA